MIIKELGRALRIFTVECFEDELHLIRAALLQATFCKELEDKRAPVIEAIRHALEGEQK